MELDRISEALDDHQIEQSFLSSCEATATALGVPVEAIVKASKDVLPILLESARRIRLVIGEEAWNGLAPEERKVIWCQVIEEMRHQH